MNQPSEHGTPRIERFRHRPYETVRSADLNDQLASHEALLAWHNRALHSTYGVVTGFPTFNAYPASERAIFASAQYEFR